MRILYLSSSNIFGGGSVALFNLIKGMKDLGHEVKVLTPCGEGDFLSMLQSVGVEYEQLEMPLSIYPVNRNILKYSILFLTYILTVKKFRKHVEQKILSYHPDIVHSNVGPLNIALNACIKYLIPHVWHHREYQDIDFGMHFFPSIKSFNTQINSLGNYNIVITKQLFSYRDFRVGVDRVIYDGVFDRKAVPQIDDRKENYVLFVGRIEVGKQPDEVISVFKNFRKKHPGMKLLLAGSYDENNAYYKKCQQIVLANDLTNDVHFLGVRKDVYELMSKAKMLVVPSKFEGFGFITVEAMLNGCIVIGRDTAGTKEQFDRGVECTGAEIALRYRTKDELLTAMEYVMNNNLKDMQNRAQEVVVKYYSIQTHVANVLAFYNDILLKNKTK